MSDLNTQNSVTRRRFLKSQAAIATIGATPLLGAVEALGAPTSAKPSTAPQDYYDKLGVVKIINAAGVFTTYCAATMPASVQLAVEQAAKHPVHLQDLQKRAGEYIAQKLRCEGAVVSCGASSALTLGTAACVQAANNCRPTDIPQEIGGKFPKNEVIVQRAHR
jgi:L-seryl-tRNA(Ser) seleniumtransferase